MRLSILNTPQKITRKLVKEATNYYASKLMSPRLLDSIFIEIKFLSEGSPELGTDKGYLRCEEVTDYPKEFFIGVNNNISKNLMLRTIAHEMVHVKQYAKGELKDYIKQPGKIRFKDMIFSDFSDQENEEYYFSPWEIEAYGREHGLYRLFMKDRKSGGQK